MNKDEIRARIKEIGIVPGVRVQDADLAVFAAESVHEAGIPIVEITMTVPGAVDVISILAKRYPDLIVGGGTVLDEETAQRCVDVGARFVTSPGLVPEVLDFTLSSDAIAIPGALTPSEVIAAWKAGADFVKIFPCSVIGGDAYIRSLKVPLPQIPLIASGGVNQLTARDFIFAGAAALGIRSELTPREAHCRTRQKQWIYELALTQIHVNRSRGALPDGCYLRCLMMSDKARLRARITIAASIVWAASFSARTFCLRNPRRRRCRGTRVKAKFEAVNPVLKSDQLGVDELKAEEITAYLRPNPVFTLSADGTQIAPHEGIWRPTSGTQVQP